MCNNKCALIKIAFAVERMGIPYVPIASCVILRLKEGGGGGGGKLIIHEMENENPLKMHTAVNNFIDSPPFGQYIFNLFNLIAINHL